MSELQITTERRAQAEMLIKFFNIQTKRNYRTSNETNVAAVAKCIDEANGDIKAIKDYIRNKASEYADTMLDCFEDFVPAQPEHADHKAAEGVDFKLPELPADKTVQYGMGLLEQAVVKLIADMKQTDIERKVMDGVEQKVRDFIKEEYGTVERKIITVVDGKKSELEGVQHEKFEQVIKFVANNEPVFLTGPAGSGKNVLCKQVATALGLDFYFTNAVTQEYKITGFTDAMGTFQETQFYKAFKYGGLFMLDEMDASIPEVLVILNAAIANKYFDFPAPIGYVEAHEDFRVIAAGNTFGQGADYEYVGRNQLDGASLDRFALVPIGYSEAIENSVACGNDELAKFCREFRKSATKSGVKVIVSYRAIGRLAKMEQLLGVHEALKTCLIKSLERDDVNIIANGLSEGKYKNAVRQIVSSMEVR